MRALDEQIEMVRAEGEGLVYRPLSRRVVKNPTTGEREQVQRAKRVKAWYWRTGNPPTFDGSGK
jgi:hypothetical protein